MHLISFHSCFLSWIIQMKNWLDLSPTQPFPVKIFNSTSQLTTDEIICPLVLKPPCYLNLWIPFACERKVIYNGYIKYLLCFYIMNFPILQDWCMGILILPMSRVVSEQSNKLLIISVSYKSTIIMIVWHCCWIVVVG